MRERITDVNPNEFTKEYAGERFETLFIEIHKELYLLRQMLQDLFNLVRK